MSTEQNKSIVRRWVDEGWNKGNLAVVDQLYIPNFVQHEPAPETVHSSQDLKNYAGAYFTAMPDFKLKIEDLIAEEDQVTMRFTAGGTQTGPLMGIPPTGKRAFVTGICIFRLKNSRIEETWLNVDTLGILQQLGVIQNPG